MLKDQCKLVFISLKKITESFRLLLVMQGSEGDGPSMHKESPCGARKLKEKKD